MTLVSLQARALWYRQQQQQQQQLPSLMPQRGDDNGTPTRRGNDIISRTRLCDILQQALLVDINDGIDCRSQEHDTETCTTRAENGS